MSNFDFLSYDLYKFYCTLIRLAVSNKSLDDVRNYFDKYFTKYFSEQNFNVAKSEFTNAVCGIRDFLVAMPSLSLMFAQ